MYGCTPIGMNRPEFSVAGMTKIVVCAFFFRFRGRNIRRGIIFPPPTISRCDQEMTQSRGKKRKCRKIVKTTEEMLEETEPEVQSMDVCRRMRTLEQYEHSDRTFRTDFEDAVKQTDHLKFIDEENYNAAAKSDSDESTESIQQANGSMESIQQTNESTEVTLQTQVDAVARIFDNYDDCMYDIYKNSLRGKVFVGSSEYLLNVCLTYMFLSPFVFLTQPEPVMDFAETVSKMSLVVFIFLILSGLSLRM